MCCWLLKLITRTRVKAAAQERLENVFRIVYLFFLSVCVSVLFSETGKRFITSVNLRNNKLFSKVFWKLPEKLMIGKESQTLGRGEAPMGNIFGVSGRDYRKE